MMNLLTRMVKTTSLVVLIGVIEVVKVGKQIIDASRYTVRMQLFGYTALSLSCILQSVTHFPGQRLC